MNRSHSPLSALIVSILFFSVYIGGHLSPSDSVTDIRTSIIPTAQTAAVADFNSSLVAHYTFDDTTNDAVSSNHGTAQGNPTYVEGKIGKALQFDGVDDAVKTPVNFQGKNTFSISLWVYVTKDTHGQRFYSAQNSGSNRFYFGTILPSGGPRLTLGLSSWNPMAQALSLNTWEHYVVTFDGTTGSLYRNGSLVLSQADIVANMPTGNLLFGCDSAYNSCTSYSFDGKIDDVRVYNKALSSEEIGYLYALGGSPVTSPPETTSPPVTTSPAIPPSGQPVIPPTTPPVGTQAPTVSGAIVTALSCSQEHVQAALDLAKDGNIVQIPEGTCTWNKTVVGKFNSPARSIIIQGAGIDKTIIIDEVPTVNTSAIILSQKVVEGKALRITGLTIKSSPNMTVAAYGGVIAIEGNSKQVRLDHIRIDITHRNQFAFGFTGDVYAVVDHSIVDNARQTARIWHNGWGGQAWGDGSFSSPLTLGTEKAVYLEDNILRGTVVTDAYGGGRYVVRSNTIETTGIPIQNHGTESSGRIRGAFSWEIYNNTFKLASSVPIFHMRSGTGVIFNNVATGSSWVTSLGTFNNYRNKDPFNPWGACDGTSPYDKNDGVVYDTGTQASGVSAVDGTLTDTSKAWVSNQWIGYSLVNVTKKWGSEITGNTASTITSAKSTYGSARPWDPGDTYQILRVDACLDQVGRSAGDLFSPDYTNPSPKAWPHQSLEPVYLWGNTLNGSSNNSASPTTYVIKRGRDFYEGIPRPGYTPYTYPHPLTTSGFTGDDPTKPLPPPALPAPLTTQPAVPTQPTTPAPPVTPLTGDFNHDGLVNSVDFSLLISAWNQPSITYDLNGDGLVNTLDYAIMAQHWSR